MELDIDSAATTEARREIVRDKRSLNRAYREFYRELLDRSHALPRGPRVEIGTGAGFLKELLPSLITTDVLELSRLDLVSSADKLPFREDSVSAFYLVNVFHHIPDVAAFLHEVVRTLQPGGRMLMIEPTSNFFSRLIYKTVHHEPFEPDAGWRLPAEGGPLSRANSALPWIVFRRDQERLAEQYPALALREYQSFMPLGYLLTGGFTTRPLAPDFALRAVSTLERKLSVIMGHCGLFAIIDLERLPN